MFDQLGGIVAYNISSSRVPHQAMASLHKTFTICWVNGVAAVMEVWSF